MNHNEQTNPIATKNKRNLVTLYLEMLNSSTITSAVAIYKKVPNKFSRDKFIQNSFAQK